MTRILSMMSSGLFHSDVPTATEFSMVLAIGFTKQAHAVTRFEMILWASAGNLASNWGNAIWLRVHRDKGFLPALRASRKQFGTAARVSFKA